MEEKEFEDFMFGLGVGLTLAKMDVGGYYKQIDTFFYYEEFNKVIMVSKNFGITVLPEIYEHPSDAKIVPCKKEEFDNAVRETIFELGLYKYFIPNE